MSLLHVPLDTISETHIQSLKANEVAESRYIEYKQQLPGTATEDRHKFLATITSFANAAGGDALYGIKEEAGVPVDAVGVEAIDTDAEILRLESMMRDSVEPRMPGINIRALKLESGKSIFIVRARQSFAAPHAVKLGKDRGIAFYSRNSAGRLQLDVPQIRSALLLSETFAARIRSFRLERLALIIANERPVPLDENARVVLHSVPFTTFESNEKFDLRPIRRNSELMKPVGAYGWGPSRFNFDGVIDSASGDKGNYSYIQVFHNGTIEAATTMLLDVRQDGTGVIPGVYFEETLIETLSQFIEIQKRLDSSPPFFVMLSLLGVKGYTIAKERSSGYDLGRFSSQRPIDRNDLLVPEVMIESYTDDLSRIMQPAFDAVWNAAGWERSMNYDDDGNRVKKR